MVDDMSKEAGKFFYGFLSQAIIDFFKCKDSAKDKLNITNIESWRPIITMLDYLKAVHNLSQSYLLSVQYMLFGGPEEDTIMKISNAPPASITAKWETHYHDHFYKNYIRPFEIKQTALLGDIENHEIDIDQLRLAMDTRQQVNEDLIGFESSAPLAHNIICEFIKTLKEIAGKIKKSNLGQFDSWGKQVKDIAKYAVRYSDESIVRVIPILTYLYEEALRQEQ